MKQYLVLPAKAYKSRKLPLMQDGNYIDKKAGDLTALQKMSTQYGGSVGGHAL